MRRTAAPAFTLIELLLAVAVFAIVSVVATITFATTVRLQSAARESQGISVQAEKALDIVSEDIRDSDRTATLVVRNAAITQQAPCAGGTSGGCYPADAIIVMNVAKKDSSGYPTTALEKHVYCISPVRSGGVLVGKRLARYVVDASSVVNATAPECTPAGIASMLTPAPSALVPTFLTDGTLNALSFRAWPVWNNLSLPAGGGNATLTDPPAVRLELTSQYNVRIGDPTFEQRSNQAASTTPQIVIRTTAVRNLP